MSATVSINEAQASAQASDASVTRYDLDIPLIPHAHRLEAAGTAKFPARPEPREAVKLKLNKFMGDLRVETRR